MVKIYFTIALSIICPFLYGQINDTISNHELVTFIERPPLFKGELSTFIKENLKSPVSDSIDLLEGTVIISYWIDTTGITVNHKVVRGLRKDLDDEAIRVAKLIRYEKPAMQRGKPIKVKFIMPFEFKREEIIKKPKCKK